MYQFFTNDPASYERAAAYALLDTVTLGIAELFTTPIESLKGDKHTVTVVYDLNDRVLGSKIKSSRAGTGRAIGIVNSQEQSDALPAKARGQLERQQKAQGI